MLDTTNTSSAAASATADSPFTILRKTRFAGLEFPKPILTKAGKILKSHGEEAALTFLEGKGEVEPCNARPPAKCEIVAISRPFAEWPISIVSAAVQKALYAKRLDEYELLAKGFKKTDAGRQFLLNRLGVSPLDLHAQALNLIIPHALNTYGGVLVKVQNLNEKRTKKAARINDRREANGFEP